MYHNITPKLHLSSGLTLSMTKFEEQLNYLVEHGFTSYFVSELEFKHLIPSKSVVITFDDVSEN